MNYRVALAATHSTRVRYLAVPTDVYATFFAFAFTKAVIRAYQLRLVIYDYLLMTVEWQQQQQRVDGCVIHIDIKDGEIWIQHDATEQGIANDLAECGVPKSDSVLGFHAPYKRPYTGFGVGRENSESQAA